MKELPESKLEIPIEIIWKGDLDDDCTAEWQGLMLRAEWMDEDYLWWAVCDMRNGNIAAESSNEYEVSFIGGEAARAKAESVAKARVGAMN